MNIEVYEINFSLDQPGYSAQRILEKLQQRLTQAKTHTGGQLFQIPHHVLLVDSHKDRVRYFGSLLSGAGYQYMVTATTVEAFTLILQGKCMPFALIIGQEDAKQRFFLNRLFHLFQVVGPPHLVWTLIIFVLNPTERSNHFLIIVIINEQIMENTII